MRKALCKNVSGANLAALKANIDAIQALANVNIKSKIDLQNYEAFLIFHTYEGLGGFDNAKLIITFDDTTDSEFTNGLPLLTAQGVFGTFFITTDWVGLGGKMTLANIQALYAAGHAVQSHSKTHTSFLALTYSQVIAECVAVDNYFTANGMIQPEHFAPPFGDSSDTIINWVSPYYSSMRGTSNGALFPMTNKYQIKGKSIDNIDALGMVALKANLDLAKFWSGAYICYCHGVTVAGGPTSVSEAMLNDLIDYAQANFIDIITVPPFNCFNALNTNLNLVSYEKKLLPRE